MVAQACNSSSGEEKAGEPKVQNHPRLYVTVSQNKRKKEVGESKTRNISPFSFSAVLITFIKTLPL